MKKLTAGLITSALVIVLGSTTALAVGDSSGQNHHGQCLHNCRQ